MQAFEEKKKLKITETASTLGHFKAKTEYWKKVNVRITFHNLVIPTKLRIAATPLSLSCILVIYSDSPKTLLPVSNADCILDKSSPAVHKLDIVWFRVY